MALANMKTSTRIDIKHRIRSKERTNEYAIPTTKRIAKRKNGLLLLLLVCVKVHQAEVLKLPDGSYLGADDSTFNDSSTK